MSQTDSYEPSKAARRLISREVPYAGAVLCLLAALLTACSSEPMAMVECEYDTACPPGMFCNARGRCEREDTTPEDGGIDLSIVDLATPVDAEPIDATSMDAPLDSEADAEALDATTDAEADAELFDAALDGTEVLDMSTDAEVDIDAETILECAPTCSSSRRCCGGVCQNESVALGTDGRGDSSFAHCGDCDTACDAEKASACSVGTSATTPKCMCGHAPSCDDTRVCVFTSGAFRCVDPSTLPDGGAPDLGAAETCGSTMCRPPSESDLGQTCCGDVCVDIDNNNCGSCGNVCPSTFEADDLGIDPTTLSALCLTAGDAISIARCSADPVSYFISTYLGGGSSFGVGCGMGSSSIMGGGATSVCCQTAGICTDALSGGGTPIP